MTIKNYQQVINAQKNLIRSGKTLQIEYRLNLLKKLKSVIKKHEDKIFDALKADLGKSKFEAYSAEIAFCYEEIDYTLKNLSKWMKPKKVGNPLIVFPAKSKIISEPLGCVLTISPWNYPFQLLIAPLITSIAAGNANVLKPSELSPNIQKYFVEHFDKEFEDQEVAVIDGGVEETTELLKNHFDFIFFTGSSQVGKIIMNAAAKHLTPVCLELGGKSPCIVDDQVDLDVAVRRIVWGKFYNAGQTCVAPDYIYVKDNIKNDFLILLKKQIENFYSENPEQAREYGRIINERNFDRVISLIDKLKVYHGGKCNKENLYIEPTILEDITWQDKIMQEEIFGPVLPVMSFKNYEEVIHEILERPKPLALYLFTEANAVKEEITSRISFGGGCINDCLIHLSNPELPFGGVGNSGMGSYHGKFGFDLMTHKKSILEKSLWPDPAVRYPPYTEKKFNLLKKFF